MKNLERDSIDFGKMDVSRLFIKIFVPTLMGLIFTSAFNIIDGIIVGKGIGSNALAAVNIAAPIYLIASAFGLMFATGASIVAAIHLSQKNKKAADINITQSMTAPLLLLIPASICIYYFAEELAYLFGSSDELIPLVVEYMKWIAPIPIFTLFLIVSTFIIRLDGSPRFAMILSIVAACLNSVLDYVFVFHFKWGLMGAAFATSFSMAVEAILGIGYLLVVSKSLHFYWIKISKTALYLTCRNVVYMVKLGFSTFIGEGAILFMIIVGNHMFMYFLHEDGVAAFSVCCYLFPLVFMFGTAIAQSQMPIISYNYGLKNEKRVRQTFNVSIVWSVCCGLLLTICGIFFCKPIISLFLNESENAYQIATEGYPYFAISFIFFTLNLVFIGFYQSIERAKFATFFMLLRGAILLIPIFIGMPLLLGEKGLWLSVPVSEGLTFIAIASAYFHRRFQQA